MQYEQKSEEGYPLSLAPLAPYASQPGESRGRIVCEAESETRTEFQRDRDRVLHARAFRRLKHKTQVFVATEGDHYRTRLTHSLEVSQIARSLARVLWINEDLAEVCALAHDLGHPPFAHLGEEALQACMAPYGGFDHNDQTLRVVHKLEKRYPAFDGLNLTWETLEGLAKHSGPNLTPGITLREISQTIDLQLDQHASLEAQVAGISDDIAYNSHDLEDGLRAGLFTLADVQDIPLLADMIRYKTQKFSGIDDTMLGLEVVRGLYGVLVRDVLDYTKQQIDRVQPESADDVRRAGFAMVDFSDPMQEQIALLRRFLMERMYLHERVKGVMGEATQILADLFTTFMNDPSNLPEPWHNMWECLDNTAQARLVADYIAGMTDVYAYREYERLLG